MKISANGLEISRGLLFAVEGSLDTSNNGKFLQRQQYGVTFKCVNGRSKHYVCENWKVVCLCDRFCRYICRMRKFGNSTAVVFFT